MELQLASGFLPLLLLTWLPAGTANKTAESVNTTQCKFKVSLDNLAVRVEWYKPEGLEMGNQTNTVALEKNCTDLVRTCMSADLVEICEFSVFIASINSTDTGNDTEGTVLRLCPAGLQTSILEKIWRGLNLPCIFFGLVVGTLIYMPILGFLLLQCRRNRKGKFTRSELAEGNQLSMAASVTGTEDLIYANLKFEENGTKPASSNIIYTEVKPLQQKQCDGDASAASTEVDVSPKEEGI